jgi:cytochrome c biogenesis protein CcdA
VKYPDLDIERLEIYHNAENQEKFLAMSRQYGIENAGIPAIFIGSRALIGDTDIKNHFEESILEEKQRLASCNGTASNTTIPSNAGCLPPVIQITPLLVIFSAAVDSINPCAFAVLIFLLISIVAIENRRRILMVGGVYISAVFIFYLLSGIGLFSVVHVSGISTALSLLGATVAVVLGIVNVIEVLRGRDEFILAIPESKKEMIEKYIGKASLPAAFVLGILVGIFELPCTGGIYLAILGLMSREMTFMEGLPYLVLYNLIFVMPLILILLLVAYGISPERANTWRIKHRKSLRFIVGIAMIAIGAIIFFGWFG